MASRRGKQQESARLQVMRVLSENPRISTRGIADMVGISNGSAYYVVKALIDKGFVKLENFTGSGSKVKYAYLLTPRGVREKMNLTNLFIKRKRQEFEDLRHELEILEKEASIHSANERLNHKKA